MYRLFHRYCRIGTRDRVRAWQGCGEIDFGGQVARRAAQESSVGSVHPEPRLERGIRADFARSQSDRITGRGGKCPLVQVSRNRVPA
jgi:hypothetical protein